MGKPIEKHVDSIIAKLKAMANPQSVEGMGRYGIQTSTALGISIPTLRKLAKEIGKNHDLACALWETDIHEARILASYIADAEQVTEAMMEHWVRDFNSWDLCDQVCGNLFDRTEFAYQKAIEWSGREEEFVKRAGFALMAWLPIHDKGAEDQEFIQFLAHIIREATDERNFVKKAVNWALRNIGKRNLKLNALAIQTAAEIEHLDSKSARWIAKDALRELTSEKQQARLHAKAKK